MYAKDRYTKYKHVVAALLYVAILLAEGGEFFVAKIDIHHLSHSPPDTTGIEIEIPDHIPENSENKLERLRICLLSQSGNKSKAGVCVQVLAAGEGIAGEVLEAIAEEDINLFS